MLSTLFKGRNPLAASSTDKRLSAIAALTAEKAARLRDEINACARNDADVRVRRAALAWVDDRALLESLLTDDEMVDAVAERLAALGIDNNHRAVRLARMRLADSDEAARRAASGVTAPELLAALFLACPDAYREALLPGVCALGERGLSVLERESRNHDKHANRRARVELDTLRGAARTVDDLSERAGELKATLARGSVATTPARAPQLRRALEECVRGINDQAEILGRYGLEIPNVDDWLSPAEAPPAEAPPPVAIAPEPDIPDFAALVTELQTLDERMAACEPLTALRETHDELAGRWLACADQAQPNREHKAVFETVSRRYQELTEATERLQNIDFPPIDVPPDITAWPNDPEKLQALWKRQRDLERSRDKLQRRLNAVAWPDWVSPPEALRTAAAKIARLADVVRRFAEHRRTLENTLATLIDKVGADVGEGHLKPARSNLGMARKVARSLPEQIARQHRKALAAVAARVEELQDWHSFATSPKRRELLDNMKALVAEAPANAKDRADRIKALRSEWNALGPVSGSGGRTLHSQFNRYAERAFEPCRAYFNEQAELRTRNLAQRRLICEQLETYLDNVDWANADMRAAELILRTARDEWRTHHPIDRRHAKELENRFEALQERIFTQIKRVWDANLDAKRTIITAAEELASSDTAIEEKVRRAKELQRRWRAVGMTPRKPDQKLWRQFREQCDQIFDARDSSRQQANNQRDSAIAQAEAICESMRQALAEAEANPAIADRATLARLRADLYALRLPERVEKGLLKRFDDIARTYNQHILAGEIEALCDELQQLRAWDIEVSEAEAEGRAIAPPATCFAQRPASGQEPLETLHRLTLEAELLAGVESPPEDRQLRLEVQVEALNQSMGKRIAEKEPRELAEAWCELGPKTAASNVLRERFFTAVVGLAQPYR